jgi:hypothetical protein
VFTRFSLRSILTPEASKIQIFRKQIFDGCLAEN